MLPGMIPTLGTRRKLPAGAGAPAVPAIGGVTGGQVILGYSEVIALTASSSDGDLDRIDWVLNPGGSETIVATDAAAAYAQNWIATQADGAHTIVARAVRGGDSTDSDPVSITITRKIWERIPTDCFAAFRADLGVTTATGVSSWASQVGGGGNLAQATGANQPALNATDATLNNQASLGFTAHSLHSDLAASAWNFLHDGTGATVFAAVHVNAGASATDVLMGTSNNGTSDRGFYLRHANISDRFILFVSNGTSTVISINTGSGAPEGASYSILATHATASTPDADLQYPIGTSAGTSSGTPSASDAARVLCIGARPGTAATDPWDGAVAEAVYWKRDLSAPEKALVSLYKTGRYGSI